MADNQNYTIFHEIQVLNIFDSIYELELKDKHLADLLRPCDPQKE